MKKLQRTAAVLLAAVTASVLPAAGVQAHGSHHGEAVFYNTSGHHAEPEHHEELFSYASESENVPAADGAQVQEGSGQSEAKMQGASGQSGSGTSGGKVASADEMVTPEDVVEDWMVPVTADQLNDGVYEAEVASSSSMFKIVECELTVRDGSMSAVMTMSGTGYLYLFMGTGEEAAEAGEEDYIPFVENEDGQHTYEIPVEALDKGIACSAFSKKKEQWYDRTLVVLSSSLPDEAFKEIEMTTVGELELADGIYQVEVTLEGGSGKTQVESPAQLTVEDGEASARIIFGSPYYDYVLVGGEKFEPVNTEGDSTFLIPVAGFDYPMAITADTVAMSQPHEIDYRLFFDSATITKGQE